MGVMTGLLLLLWAGVAVSTPVDLQKRIIGGRDCGKTERLYHVKLIGSKGTDETLCGGSLISNQWILTAEHCWETEPGWTLTAYLRESPKSDKLVKMKIQEHHPFVNQTRTHDIMLLKLEKRTPNPTQIKPVPLPDCRKPLKPGNIVEVAGYGPTTMDNNNKRGDDDPTFLQCANMEVQVCKELSDCFKRNYPDYYREIKDEHLQCLKSPGVDISPGDSGGGVVFNGRIYGVNVNVGNHTHACVAPAGFMDVCKYKDWIVKTTSIPRPTPRPRSQLI